MLGEPDHSVGATTTGRFSATSRAARRQASLHKSSSTPVARCGPCCSVEATGKSTIAPSAARPRKASAVMRFHRISVIGLLP